MPKIAPTSPLYAQFRQDFPAQAGEGITGDLNYSDTIVPIVDMTNAAGEGVLAQNLQTAWDFSTGFNSINNNTFTIVNTPGFWQLDLNATLRYADGGIKGDIRIDDGSSFKKIWQISNTTATEADTVTTQQDKFVVYLRSGDDLKVNSTSVNCIIDVWFRQIADLNGNLVNPLGFSFN